jgi:glycosyltransferase involved in cell wall biosynthesis
MTNGALVQNAVCRERFDVQSGPGNAPSPQASVSSPMRLLAYVHLRNIHESTGAGRVARQLIEHLARRKDIELKILADAADHARIVPLVGDPWDGFNYRLFSTSTSRQQTRWFALDRPDAEDYWPESQIVYCTAESYVPKRKARLCVTLHDAAFFEAEAHIRDRAFWSQRLKWKLLYDKLARKADLFHTVSYFSAERLVHFFPAIRSRIRVVHNAVAPLFFAPLPAEGQEFLERSGLSDKPFVLVPGGLHHRKNAELILAASAILERRFPELTVVVVNHSDPAYVKQAQSLGAKFRLLGFVPDEALHALYTAAQVVWFPSRYEGFGLPVIEAMACGAPVVASNAASIPEIAGGSALLVDPFDPQAHVDAIHDLLVDSRMRAEYTRSGRARAALFTWGSSADTLKKCFEAVL